MQTCFMVSKRKNGGRMTKVRPSITLNDETDKLLGNPSSWNEYKCISFNNKEITYNSLPAESPSEKLTNMQLKAIWNNIYWHKVEEHVNRLQIRITKAVKLPPYIWVMRCLSCMKRKFHVQFLGEKGGVILPTYPTIADQSDPFPLKVSLLWHAFPVNRKV